VIKTSKKQFKKPEVFLLKKIFYHVFSVILAVLFFVTQSPDLVHGLTETLTTDTEKIVSTVPGILEEVKEKREECVKHFRMSDGSMLAIVYSEPVHYKEENEFKEIDNTLIFDTEKNEFENADSPLKVKLSSDFSNEKLVSLKSGNKEISWRYIQKQPEIEKPSLPQIEEENSELIQNNDEIISEKILQNNNDLLQNEETSQNINISNVSELSETPINEIKSPKPAQIKNMKKTVFENTEVSRNTAV
jgi:hypothetical protein